MHVDRADVPYGWVPVFINSHGKEHVISVLENLAVDVFLSSGHRPQLLRALALTLESAGVGSRGGVRRL